MSSTRNKDAVSWGNDPTSDGKSQVAVKLLSLEKELRLLTKTHEWIF